MTRIMNTSEPLKKKQTGATRKHETTSVTIYCKHIIFRGTPKVQQANVEFMIWAKLAKYCEYIHLAHTDVGVKL